MRGGAPSGSGAVFRLLQWWLLLAVLVGIPLGLIVTRLLFDYLGRQMGMGAELGMIPPWWWLALLAPGALLVSILGSVIPARQAAQVRVVEVLRYE